MYWVLYVSFDAQKLLNWPLCPYLGLPISLVLGIL